MNDTIFDYDDYFKNLGLDVLSQLLNSYLASNYPTDQHRKVLESLYENFPDFRGKAVVYRAVKQCTFPKTLRNKFVGGCLTIEDVQAFVKKRYDKGYKYVLISKEPIDYFNLRAFIDFINIRYGKYITERYQDENEVLFKLKKGNKWFRLEKI
ncbi:MAG: hypothetical protein M0Q94_09435 [Candidatus Cloacimonetes bacterium]|nr:hypothetical protein [Candidatus Cloacimonadota bacterium]